MRSRGYDKSFLIESCKNIYRENTAFWEILVIGFVVLYLTHRCPLLEPCCSETAFAKQRLASADFSDDNFSGKFCWKLG